MVGVWEASVGTAVSGAFVERWIWARRLEGEEEGCQSSAGASHHRVPGSVPSLASGAPRAFCQGSLPPEPQALLAPSSVERRHGIGTLCLLPWEVGPHRQDWSLLMAGCGCREGLQGCRALGPAPAALWSVTRGAEPLTDAACRTICGRESKPRASRSCSHMGSNQQDELEGG